VVVVAITTMIDYGKLWLHSMIASGETAMALRTNGYDWREIATQLQMDVDGARKAAALFLSADLHSRQAAQGGTSGDTPGDIGGILG
jgi:hypothetical protein